jgi:hypothetical protein
MTPDPTPASKPISSEPTAHYRATFERPRLDPAQLRRLHPPRLPAPPETVTILPQDAADLPPASPSRLQRILMLIFVLLLIISMIAYSMQGIFVDTPTIPTMTPRPGSSV